LAAAGALVAAEVAAAAAAIELIQLVVVFAMQFQLARFI
jgi:hypothetical protein